MQENNNEQQVREPESGKGKKTIKQEIFEWAKAIIFALVVVLILRTFVFQLIRVDGTSMLETLQHNDIIFTTMFDQYFGTFEHGDVVICNYPGVNGYRVKRIIGMPGDTVEIRDNVTYVNGEVLEEEYVTHMPRSDYGPITVPEGYYFVMGDNRTVSKDSRSASVGPIAISEVKGKVRCVIFPFNAIRTVE